MTVQEYTESYYSDHMTPSPPPKQDPTLPATTYAILGLLTFGETSGYDLIKLVEHSIAHFFFNPAKSQIYLKLRRLVEEGFATERAVEQTDRPDKRLFRITPKGERALRRWLEDPRVEHDSFTSPILLKVFFGHLAPRDTLARQIRDSNRQAKESLAQLQMVERQIESLDRSDLDFPHMVLKAGLTYTRAWVRATSDIAQEIDRQIGQTQRQD